MISIGKITTFILITFLALNSFSQTGTLKGNVKDEETGETLIGATVQLVGTYLGAATDIDGNYTIPGIKPGDYSVKITFLGYGDKIYNGIRIKKDEVRTLDVEVSSNNQTLGEVTIVGEKNFVDLESASSEIKLDQSEIQQLNTRNVKEIAALQAGVDQTTDGLQIRGARVYETQYLIDGISAQDPLAGNGFGVDVSSGSIDELNIVTGGVGAEYGDGTAGLVATTIREGSGKYAVSGSWQRDNLFGDKNDDDSWNTDIVELSLAGPIPGTKKKLTFFTNLSVNLTDEYYGPTADQLHSSLFPDNDSLWAPRQNNSYSHTLKFAYQFKSGSKLTLTNQHSLNINQNTRSLQIIGTDAILTPGYQYYWSLDLDNATTYTHQSNLTVINFKHLLSEKVIWTSSLGRLHTSLRADANGRPFRSETVDQIYDGESIVTDPVDLFNPDDPIIFVLPGPGLANNGGISGLWHDHYAREYTVKNKFSFFPKNKRHQISVGQEHKFTEYQWADINDPWVGAPIVVNDTLTIAATSIGSSQDIWKANPFNGGIFVQDKITYQGIIAVLGARLNYWAPGKFADDAVENPNSPVIDQIREDYQNNTFGLFGYRMKARLLPKINVSFPVTDNNVMYFNYGHSMRLPHPRFLYAGLDPVYQDQSFLDDLGNPDLNPEVNVSYEVGIKSQLTRDLAVTISAFNNNRFEYIVQRRVLVEDATGRTVSKKMYINQDYAKINGLETGIHYRLIKYFRLFFNMTYQVARGKSNSARESGLQIEQNGSVALTEEQYLAFDRPWDLTTGVVFNTDSTFKIAGVPFGGFQIYLSFNYKSGYRYTPQELEGYNDLGRPLYVELEEEYLSELSKSWFTSDLKISKAFKFGKKNSIGLNIEIRNLFDNRNGQIINPVTGRAYEVGDDVPNTWRDPRYIGPEEDGVPPDNPARYLPPRQILYGLTFNF